MSPVQVGLIVFIAIVLIGGVIISLALPYWPKKPEPTHPSSFTFNDAARDPKPESSSSPSRKKSSAKKAAVRKRPVMKKSPKRR